MQRTPSPTFGEKSNHLKEVAGKTVGFTKKRERGAKPSLRLKKKGECRVIRIMGIGHKANVPKGRQTR